MAPRPNWKGYLKLSLVTSPIALYPAITPAERVSFRQVNKATGNRLRQQLVDAVTGEAVQPEDKARGYDVSENQYLVVEDEELESARQVARTLPFTPSPPTSPSENRVLPRPEQARPLAPGRRPPLQPPPPPGRAPTLQSS